MRRSLQFATVLLSLSFAATTVFAQGRGDTSASNSNSKSTATSSRSAGGSTHFSGRTLSTQPSPGYVSPFQQQIHLPGGGTGCRRCGYGVYGGYAYSGYEGEYYNGVGPSATDRILANGGTFKNINDSNSEQQSAPQQAPIYIRPEYPTNYATDNSTVNTPLQNNVASASSDSPALLIFKDGSKMTIRNYAIYGAYIVVLTPERRKFPIASLDVAATQKANEEAGYELKLPAVFTNH